MQPRATPSSFWGWPLFKGARLVYGKRAHGPRSKRQGVSKVNYWPLGRDAKHVPLYVVIATRRYISAQAKIEALLGLYYDPLNVPPAECPTLGYWTAQYNPLKISWAQQPNGDGKQLISCLYTPQPGRRYPVYRSVAKPVRRKNEDLSIDTAARVLSALSRLRGNEISVPVHFSWVCDTNNRALTWNTFSSAFVIFETSFCSEYTSFPSTVLYLGRPSRLLSASGLSYPLSASTTFRDQDSRVYKGSRTTL